MTGRPDPADRPDDDTQRAWWDGYRVGYADGQFDASDEPEDDDA